MVFYWTNTCMCTVLLFVHNIYLYISIHIFLPWTVILRLWITWYPPSNSKFFHAIPEKKKPRSKIKEKWGQGQGKGQGQKKNILVDFLFKQINMYIYFPFHKTSWTVSWRLSYWKIGHHKLKWFNSKEKYSQLFKFVLHHFHKNSPCYHDPVVCTEFGRGTDESGQVHLTHLL